MSERDALQSQVDMAAPEAQSSPSGSHSGSGDKDSAPEPNPSSNDNLLLGGDLPLGEQFVLDGFEIVVHDNIEWDTVSNQFSDYDGADVIKIPMTMKNLNSDTQSFRTSRYDFYGSKGTKLDGVSAYFDNAHKAGDDMRSGAELTRYLCLLYDGDGDYYIEFEHKDTKVEIKVPVSK